MSNLCNPDFPIRLPDNRTLGGKIHLCEVSDCGEIYRLTIVPSLPLSDEEIETMLQQIYDGGFTQILYFQR